MRFTLFAPMEIAVVLENRDEVVPSRWIAEGVSIHDLFGEDVPGNAFNATRGPGKTAVDDFGADTNCFENLRALVALECGNTHLGHDLQHALGHGFTIGGHDGLVVAVYVLRNLTFLTGLPDCFECQVRIDGIGTVTGQQAMMVDLPRFAGLKEQTDTGAGKRLNQVLMYCTTGDQCAEWNSCF